MAGKKIEKVKYPELLVDKDVISYGEAFICTRNISMVGISQIPSNYWWVLGLISVLLGVYSIDEMGVVFIVVGAVIFLISVCVNANRGENLAIALNSGQTFYFHCKSKDFIRRVLKNMILSIKQGNRATYKVNFNSCTIDNINMVENK